MLTQTEDISQSETASPRKCGSGPCGHRSSLEGIGRGREEGEGGRGGGGGEGGEEGWGGGMKEKRLETTVAKAEFRVQ